jgi:hypothetical protein
MSVYLETIEFTFAGESYMRDMALMLSYGMAPEMVFGTVVDGIIGICWLCRPQLGLDIGEYSEIWACITLSHGFSPNVR